MPAIEDRLRHVLSPLYLQLFNLIGQLEGVVKFLVALRADLLVSFLHHNYPVSVAVDFNVATTVQRKILVGENFDKSDEFC